MARDLVTWPLLDGFRGRPRWDVDAFASAIVAFSEMVALLGERLVEAEINPIFVLPAGQGVRAAGGILVLGPVAPECQLQSAGRRRRSKTLSQDLAYARLAVMLCVVVMWIVKRLLTASALCNLDLRDRVQLGFSPPTGLTGNILGALNAVPLALTGFQWRLAIVASGLP